MNLLMIIGNLTKDPELRYTQEKTAVCSFTVAVNRRGKEETDFFRVTVWRQLAESCAKFLKKGRKVSVVGAVSLSTYTTKDGKSGASLEVNASDVEFLSPKDEQEKQPVEDHRKGYVQVQDDDLPWS